jgi:hypothetical protein
MEGNPVCALVLANGQYVFSCDGTGAYQLNVPLDVNGEVTVSAFADGFTPFTITAIPNRIPPVLRLVESAADYQTSAQTPDAVALDCPSDRWVDDTPSFEIEEEPKSDSIFLIDGRLFEAKTLCVGWDEGQRIIFDDGRAPRTSYCISATLYNLEQKQTCDVWCK